MVGTDRTIDEPAPGDILGGRYEILEEVGRGGMATVYKGRDLRLSRKVAVKVFRDGFADSVDPRRIAQEMHLLAGMNHPSIVSVLDASTGDGRFGTYLVMELVVGEDLGALLRRARGPLSADYARRIVADVAGALALLHGQGVVHRDVKPGNILVCSAKTGLSGVTAKLTDFGIAQMVDGAAITAPDSILGTAAYLSPEQVRGARLRPASDVYSLGLVLLEALTGRRVFPGPPAEAAVARLTRPPALPPEASPALAELLSRMTALDPTDRPRAAEVAAALREGLAGAITAPDATSTAEVPRAGVEVPPAPVAAAPVPLEAAAEHDESTLPHPSRWTPAAGIPLSAAALAQPEQERFAARTEPGRRFPTLLAVAASALAAAAAGVLIPLSTGAFHAPQPAAAVGGALGAVAAAPPAASSTASSSDAGTAAPLHITSGGPVIATTPHRHPTSRPTASSPAPSSSTAAGTPSASGTPSGTSTPASSPTSSPAASTPAPAPSPSDSSPAASDPGTPPATTGTDAPGSTAPSTDGPQAVAIALDGGH